MNLDKHIPLSLFGEAAATLNESIRDARYAPTGYINEEEDEPKSPTSSRSRSRHASKRHLSDVVSEAASSSIATHTLNLPSNRRNSILKAQFLDDMMEGIENEESEAEAISSAAKHTKQLKRQYKRMEDAAIQETKEEHEEAAVVEMGVKEMEDRQRDLQSHLHMHDKTMRGFIQSIVQPAASSVVKSSIYNADEETVKILHNALDDPSSNSRMINLKMKYNKMNTAFEDLGLLLFR
jgi:uncharacterized protein (DUF1778 family)